MSVLHMAFALLTRPSLMLGWALRGYSKGQAEDVLEARRQAWRTTV